MSTTTKTTESKTTPRRERQIYNRTKYRLTKRRNLWLRSLALAKDPAKAAILKTKIEAFDLALSILEDA